MIQSIRILIPKGALRTAAGRMIFFTGLIGFMLVTMNGVLHTKPALARALATNLSMVAQQRLLVVLTLLLFAAAYYLRRYVEQSSQTFLNQLLDFWEFRPLRERQLSCRCYEAAHLALIALMFHRALFI